MIYAIHPSLLFHAFLSVVSVWFDVVIMLIWFPCVVVFEVAVAPGANCIPWDWEPGFMVLWLHAVRFATRKMMRSCVKDWPIEIRCQRAVQNCKKVTYCDFSGCIPNPDRHWTADPIDDKKCYGKCGVYGCWLDNHRGDCSIDVRTVMACCFPCCFAGHAQSNKN